MTKYFDKKNNRLVCEEEKACSEFWDQHWQSSDIKKSLERVRNNNTVVRITKKFLRPSREIKILEGGCGNGKWVSSLYANGYDAYGVDYADSTIKIIKQIRPDLKVSCGDLRRLDFSDDYFDGYWSLGVIEHFYDGYDDIMKEMKRVIKNNGWLFLEFPSLSPLRKLKMKLGFYKEFKESDFNKELFYQFILNPEKVINDFKKEGFELVHKKNENGFKGLNDEVNCGLLKKINKSKNLFFKAVKLAISELFSFFSSHAILLVFKNKK